MMNTQRRRSLLSLSLTVAVTAILASCGSDRDPSTAPDPSTGPDCQTGTSLTLLVPVHQGASAPSVPKAWECHIARAITQGVSINVVTVEGRPTVVLRDFRAELSTVGPSVTRDDLVAAENTVIDAVTTAKATSDGSDLLAALALAGDLATSAGPDGQVLSLDNGLTDTGQVRFTDPGATEQSGEDLAAWVSERGQCPHLHDVTITFYGLAYGADPQPALSTRQRNAVVTAWLAIAQTCGATASSVPLPRTTVGPTTTFTTATVAPEPEQTLAAPTSCHVELGDIELGFLPESDQFVDEDAARTRIEAAAREISACPGQVKVVGTTSSAGTPEGRTRVSTARASRVREILASTLGVPTSQIEMFGAGFDPAYGCVNDRVNGVLDPGLAQLNRKTTVTVTPH